MPQRRLLFGLETNIGGPTTLVKMNCEISQNFEVLDTNLCQLQLLVVGQGILWAVWVEVIPV